MKWQFIGCLALCWLFVACKTNDGNQVISYHTNSNPGQGGKVIFRGKNNKLILRNNNVQHQSTNNQDVVIIEGNRNRVEINSTDLQNNAQNSQDTLLIQGNHQQLTYQQSGIDSSRNSRQRTDLSADEIAQYAVLQQVRYCRSIENGDTLTQEEYRQSERELQPLVAAKNPYAQLLQGKVQGMLGRPKEALALLENSAKQGYLPTLLHLGDVYAYSLYGIAEDKALALSWFRKAMAKGSTYAESMVDWLD